MIDNTFSYPPTIQRAQIHAQATQIFKAVDPKQLKRCQCCQRIVGSRMNINCCYDPKELAFLGQGFPLYFLMIRNCIALIIVMLASFGAYGLYSNFMGDECSSGATKCEVNIFNQLSILNKSSNNQMLQLQNYMVLGGILALVIAMQFVRRAARILEAECDRLVDSPSDYSMIIRGLPDGYEEKDIVQMIEKRKKFLTPNQLNQTQGLAIQKIVMAYSLKAINQTQQKNIENFKKSIKDKTKFVEQELPKAHKLSPTAIVVFSSQKSKDFFISEPKLYQKIAQFFWSVFIPKSDYTVKDTYVSIQRAPQPDDINWANCGISLCGTISRRILGLIITLLFLGVGAGLQIGLQKLDQSITDPNTKTYSSTIFSLIVSIFNGIIGALLIIVTKKQRIQTVTEYNQRLAIKISVYQFINAGILVIISNSILDFKNFSLSSGLASECTMIMVMNVIIPNLTLFIINFAAPMKWWQRRSIKKKLEEKQPKDIYIQEEVNSAFEDVDVDIAARYSFILRTVWLTALFAPFIPIVLPLSALSLFFNYHIQKFLFIRAYKVPNMTSSILDNEMIEMLEYVPLVLAIGNYFLYLYFVNFVFQQVPLYYGIPIYISIAISVINMFLPMGGLNEKLFKLKNLEYRRPSFREIEHKFITDYDIANPVYRIQNKKRKNFQFFNNLTPLGQMIEMTQLNAGKQGEKMQEGNPGTNPFAALFNAPTQPTVFDSPKKQQQTPLLIKKTEEDSNSSTVKKNKAFSSYSQEQDGKIISRLKPMSPAISVRNLLENASRQNPGTPKQTIQHQNSHPQVPPLNLHKIAQNFHHQNTMPLPANHQNQMNFNQQIGDVFPFMAPMGGPSPNFAQGPQQGFMNGNMGMPMGPQPNQMNFNYGRAQSNPMNPYM